MAQKSCGKNTRMNGVLGPVISRRSYVGWTTKGHTGEDIFFYYYGTDRPVGTIENKDIARMMADAMGFKLDVTDSRLLASANEVFDGTGASINIDKGDPENKVLVIEAAGKRAELPFSKNIIRVRTKDGLKQHEMEGVTVFSPKTGKVYLPRQAVSIFMKEVIKEGKKNKKALEKN